MSRSIILIVLSFCIIGSSCTKEFFSECTEGNSTIDTLQANVGVITHLEIGFTAKTTIDEGPFQTVELIGPSNIIQKIISDSDYANGLYDMKLKGCSDYDEVKINIVMSKLVRLGLSGSSEVTFLSKFDNVEDVEFDMSGASIMDINLGAANTVNINMSGSAQIDLQGSANDLSIEVSGSGDIMAFDFPVKTCTVDVSGQGNVQVNVENDLDVVISGSATVCYRGSPALEIDLSGTGQVLDCN